MSEPVASVGTRHTSVMWVAKHTEQQSLVHLLAPASSTKGEALLPVPNT